MQASPDGDIILYDGVCVLCSGWMRLVAKRDRERRFRFTAIQSPYGRALALSLGIDPDDPDTNAVIIDGEAYLRSHSALAALSVLPGWGWTGIFRPIPRPIRDRVYRLIARNRYNILGRHDRCEVDELFADRIVS